MSVKPKSRSASFTESMRVSCSFDSCVLELVQLLVHVGGSVLPGMLTSPANAGAVSIDTQRAIGRMRFIVNDLAELIVS